MKKWMITALSLLLALSLSACGSSTAALVQSAASKDRDDEPETEDTEETGDAGTAEEDAAEAETADADEALLEELQAEADAVITDPYSFHADVLASCGEYRDLYVYSLAFARDYDDGTYFSYTSRDYLNHLTVENGEIVFDYWYRDDNFDTVRQDFETARTYLKQGNLEDGRYLLQQAEETGTDSCIMDYIDRMLGAFTLDESGKPTAFDVTLGVLGEHIDEPICLDGVEAPESNVLSVGDTFTLTVRLFCRLDYDSSVPSAFYYCYDDINSSFGYVRTGDFIILTYSFEALPSMAGDHSLVIDSFRFADAWGNTLTLTPAELGFPDTITIQ